MAHHRVLCWQSEQGHGRYLFLKMVLHPRVIRAFEVKYLCCIPHADGCKIGERGCQADGLLHSQARRWQRPSSKTLWAISGEDEFLDHAPNSHIMSWTCLNCYACIGHPLRQSLHRWILSAMLRCNLWRWYTDVDRQAGGVSTWGVTCNSLPSGSLASSSVLASSASPGGLASWKLVPLMSSSVV